jgi:riboflavin kinase/FMN adenylyltransferase
MTKQAQVLDDFGKVSIDGASSVCLGNFDGLHRAHQEIFKRCLHNAKRYQLASVVFTFEPHPMHILQPAKAPPRILSREEKRELLSAIGFDIVVEQKFDKTFMKMSAKKFVEDVLVKHLCSKFVVIGPHFRFGFQARGDVALLQKNSFFEVEEIEALRVDGQKISSTRIRDLLQGGNLNEVNELLGYSYFLSGKVVAGKKRGHELGFPTANIATSKEALPCAGIYATIFEDLAEKKFFAAATNVGFNPTFGEKHLTIEPHLIDFRDDLYGREVRLHFIRRLRAEQKFGSAGELRMQIEADVREVRQIFHSLNLLQGDNEKSIRNLKDVDLLTQCFQPLGSLQKLISL